MPLTGRFNNRVYIWRPEGGRIFSWITYFCI